VFVAEFTHVLAVVVEIVAFARIQMIIPLFLPTFSSPFLPQFSSFHCHPFSHPTSSQHAYLLNHLHSILPSFPT
jgi:hypothetical protein